MYRTKLKNLRNAFLLYIVITLCCVTTFATSRTMATLLTVRANKVLACESYDLSKTMSLDIVQVPTKPTVYLAEAPNQLVMTMGLLTKPSSTVETEPMVQEFVVSEETQESIAEAIQTASTTEATETEPEIIVYYTEDDVVILAKIIQVEAGGISSFAERAAVAWCILNRVDYDGSSYSFPSTIAGCATEPGQFAYYSGTQYTEENYWIAADVLERWNFEQNGYTDVGRTLPSEYLFFSGDGSHNHFRTDIGYGNGSYDWSLGSPYEEDN